MCAIAQTIFGMQCRFGNDESKEAAMAPQYTDQDWRCIAEQASGEMDPEKLIFLIGELCQALDERKLKPWQRSESRLLAAD